MRISKVMIIYDKWKALPCPNYEHGAVECEGISKCRSCREEFERMLKQETRNSDKTPRKEQGK